ncbi:MAG: hypothetical protein K2G62_02635 [Oscillospiraceae bacterium]|nr:hypothetical protein [Oscillospiraceae bacterium]
MKKFFSIFTLGLISMVLLSCGVSTSANETTKSYNYTVNDISNFQKFLLAEEKEEHLNNKPYNLNNDDKWNVFDLCLMKRSVLNQQGRTGDTLVAYFSRTGNTEKVANHIIALTDADKYVIEAAVPYTDEDIAYNNPSCRANIEQNDKSVRPEIAEPLDNIKDYDIIYLGYPIWWGEEPRIIDTFLEAYDFSDKTIIPFATSGSSGITASENNIRNLGVEIGKQLSGKRFSANVSKEDVSAWLDTLELVQNTEKTCINIEVNGKILTSTLENNSSAKAFADMLKDKSLTLELDDYGNFEKVGALPQSLPSNDKHITTEPGDIILYQGDKITIYYDENTWSFTKLGHIDNVTQNELKSILGDGSVKITFSLKK